MALGLVIRNLESRIADDHLDVDTAELYVRRVRSCQALMATFEPEAVTA
jgi:hypothetical protein